MQAKRQLSLLVQAALDALLSAQRLPRALLSTLVLAAGELAEREHEDSLHPDQFLGCLAGVGDGGDGEQSIGLWLLGTLRGRAQTGFRCRVRGPKQQR